MSFKKLEEFIQIAKDAGVKELEYSDGDKRFAISFPIGSAPVMHHSVSSPETQPVPSSPKIEKMNAPGVVDITSPFVGTFYMAPSPDAPSYVKIGDNISSGQVLCIVEAMKIMNEIESDISGEVVELCVEDESYVEFGQTLFKVKKS